MPIILTLDDRWDLIKAYIKENGLTKQHLASYNEFVTHGLQRIIYEFGGLEVKDVKIRFDKVHIGAPIVKEADGSERNVLPMEARLRNLTYAGPLYITITKYVDGVREGTTKVFAGYFPIMVRSVLCPLSRMSSEELVMNNEDPKDPGGYFIINGSERVLVAQEDLADNHVLVDVLDGSSNVTHLAKVLSSAAGLRIPTSIERLRDGTLHVVVPSIASRIPLFIVMRALGLESDRQIVEAITWDPEIEVELLPSLEAASEIQTVEDALDYIGGKIIFGQPRQKRIERAELVLDKYFLPSLGTRSEDRIKKAYFLGQMVEKLLEVVLGRRKPDDKDHYANKRLRLAGDLLASLFRVIFKRFCQDLQYQLEKVWNSGKTLYIENIVRADLITERLRHALATGNWIGGKVGVSQLLDRTNYLSTLSHLRRVVSPLSRSQPHFEARDLHATQWGRICPNESPEGPNCGLVKNLSLMARITVGIDETEIESKLYELGVVPIQKAKKEEREKPKHEGEVKAKVFLNGRLIGIHNNPNFLVEHIREERRKGKISPEVNVAYIETEYIREVYVNCDGGRIVRPLIVVRNGKPSVTSEHVEKLRRGEWVWDDFIKRGLIEYLDAMEEENAYIAINPEDVTLEHTHLEIMPAAIVGVCAAIIPYAEHNQSPRNSYEAAMAKQALGFSSANMLLRMDSRGHFLHYPQKPLAQTRLLDVIGYNDRPAGQNMVVAVLTLTGYNIEDALVFSRSAVDRGLARSTFFRTYEAEEMRYPGGEEDRIERPPPNVRGYRAGEVYRHLGEDGVAEVEAHVRGGDVLIGRTSPPRFMGEYRDIEAPGRTRRETSVDMRHGESGIVDAVLITETSEGNRLIKVRVRDLRVPELGDKFASRHGQKGIIGLLLPHEDLPFTEEGIVPDVIINPHAFPSRMTIGQLLESMAGKVAALKGNFVDSTTFYGIEEKQLREELKRLGFQPSGCEVMYDGVTGEMCKTPIFMGIVYYQKLHHMVADKIHARARGPVQILTRQPTEGRAREGGLRFGEMERDCLVAHGAAALLKDRLLEESDRTTVYVCEDCGLVAYYDAISDRYKCPLCEEKAKVSQVTMSYAFKLLLQELMSLGIYPRLKVG
ncbi:MAG: DNA-directed RNA polymerase subunit B [Candidatus Nezhaarchaeota archaeon]|nr:DNA-directed RNA polymerase subunit B [Candidatus Nezhaarchaeota archaeon]